MYSGYKCSFSESKNFLSRENCHINQSIISIIYHPKMPRFSKRANLLKELEAVATSHVIKAYLCFYLDAEDSFEDDLDHLCGSQVVCFEIITLCI